MIRIGYTLSSEEHDPKTLIKNAQRAEEVGFAFVSISDHFHPWVDEQGQSPFVWSVLGALSQVTKTVNVLVGVNCPIIRYHPATIAQAAATTQEMLEGRFLLGVGTGENLNEHIIGQGWPPIHIRRQMLIEAIEIMRRLWQGGYQSYYGKFFFVDAARIYTLPQNSIPIIISGYGPTSTTLAGMMGDGYITTKPDKKLVQTFEKSGGKGKPKFAQVSVCFDKDSQKAQQILKKVWPLSAMPKPLNTELRLPQDFQNTAQLISVEDVTKSVPTGANPQPILGSIQTFRDAGFDNIYIHNIGPNQEEFLEFASREILPHFTQHTKSKKEPSPKTTRNKKVVEETTVYFR